MYQAKQTTQTPLLTNVQNVLLSSLSKKREMSIYIYETLYRQGLNKSKPIYTLQFAQWKHGLFTMASYCFLLRQITVKSLFVLWHNWERG